MKGADPLVFLCLLLDVSNLGCELLEIVLVRRVLDLELCFKSAIESAC